MLLLPSPFQEALDARTAFVKSVSVTATRGDESRTFEPSGGQLTQDNRRSLRWNGSLTIPVAVEDVPTVPQDLLTPFGTTVTVELGVVLANSSVATVPFGVYDLDDMNVALAPDSRLVTIGLVDLGERLARYRFESPYAVPAGTDVADAVELVVADRLGITLGLTPTGNILARPRVFGLEPSLDPAREIIELVGGFGYRIYFDRTGTLVLDQQPIPDPALAVALGGEITVTGAMGNRPPNVMVVRGEASDETPPIQAVAYDDDSNSPTYAGTNPGETPYNRVTRFFASPLITTQGEANLAAQNMLAGFAAQAANWDVTKAYDPTIDPDDVLTIALDEATNLPLVVDAVTVDIAGATSAQCRAISQLVA